MTPTKQRIAIAEACGWKVKRRDITGYNVWEPDAEFPAQLTNNIENKLPNYLNDLNAMHKAEKTLPTDSDDGIDRHSFRTALRAICLDVGNDAIHATAAQRAEAFLKTLGKWVE